MNSAWRAHAARLAARLPSLGSVQLPGTLQYFPIVGFDSERRNDAEHDQYPSDQASIPKESVDHELLLSSSGWRKLT
jgi:hypothetical protein